MGEFDAFPLVDDAAPQGNEFDAFPLVEEAPAAVTEQPQPTQPIPGPAAPVEDPFVVAGSLQKPDVPLADLARSAVGQGLLFGFGDEIEAKIRSFFGENEEQALQSVRQQVKEFQDRNPGLSITTEVVGALVPALLTGGIGLGGTLARQTGRAALTGAAFGGAGAAGRGETPEERIERGLTGAAIGGTVGAVVPGATELARRGVSAVTQPIRGLISPEAEAARRVSGALERDVRIGQAGLGDQEFRAAQTAGQPVANVDIGGETTRALARSAANVSPEGRAALNRLVDDRFESQGPRIAERFREITERSVKVQGKAIRATSTRSIADALKDAARKSNAPAYKRAFSQGDRPLTSPELERLMTSPAVVQAMKRAVKSGKDRAVRDGFGGFNAGVKVSDDGVITFTRTNAQGVPQAPNLQYWDSVKRELDGVAGRAFRSGDNEAGGVASGLARQLREELDALVPSYTATRSRAAKFFDAEDAAEAGKKFVRGNQDLRQARGQIAKMSPAERALFANSFADETANLIGSVSDRSNVVNRIFGSTQAREKIAVALGPKRAQELEAFFNVETQMDTLRGALGNSTTARQLVEAGLAGGGFGLATGDLSPQNVFSAAFIFGAARLGGRRIDANVARKVAEQLASPNPAIAQRGIERVAKSSRLMDALREAGRRVTLAIGAPAGAVAEP